jgi:hypothetical protein
MSTCLLNVFIMYLFMQARLAQRNPLTHLPWSSSNNAWLFQPFFFWPL